jgi:hypothetical protein
MELDQQFLHEDALVQDLNACTAHADEISAPSGTEFTDE